MEWIRSNYPIKRQSNRVKTYSKPIYQSQCCDHVVKLSSLAIKCFILKIKVEREHICVFPDYTNTIVQCIDLQIIIAKNVGFPLLTAFDKSAFIADNKICIVDFPLTE